MNQGTIVIGGSGFVGSRITYFLGRASGHAVSVYDRKSPASIEVNFYEGDLLDYASLRAAIEGHANVVHCAAMLGVEACFTDSASVGAVNISGTANVLRAAVDAGVSHLIFLSSSEVYGDGAREPFKESQDLTPKTFYGATKVLGERMCSAYANNSPLRVSVARLFNVYGPGQSRDFVVNKFILNALSGKGMTIYGDGKQSRTFTYVDDAAKGVCALITSAHKKDQSFRVYNIAGRNPVTINELAGTVRQVLPECPPPIYVALGADGSRRCEETEIFYRVPDTSQASNDLAFSASTPLAEGITRSVSWVRKTLQEALNVSA